MAQVSILDTFVPQLHIAKDVFLKSATSPTVYSRNLRLARAMNMLQPEVNDDVPFPCPLNNTKSTDRPTSVHNLRPGDIDIIAAIGDSLTAGNGLLSTNILQVLLQNRGISFSIGGQGTWRQYVTIPNILKVFNPNLYGYSLFDSFVHNKASQFNVAEAGAISADLTFMSKELIRRIQNDPKVNIELDWKMINFMIGSNDFCSTLCHQKNYTDILESHKNQLTQSLRILRDSLPRTIVNMILPPGKNSIRGETSINRPDICYFSRNFNCPCLVGLQYKNQQPEFESIMSGWYQVQTEVANSAEFHRQDFTVVVQPLFANHSMPKNEKNLTDYASFAQDCFHLSQKENARAATALWNNLLEPVGRKSTSPTTVFDFKCPTMEHPYIFTNNNS